MLQHPCPLDPNFPSLGDYDLIYDNMADGRWRCDARAKTKMARLVRLDSSYGRTKNEARKNMKATYQYRAGRMTNEDWFRIQMGWPAG